MEVLLAKSAGFCFGVKRAVEQVYEQIEKGGPIYTYGPIIHNEEVVNDLAKKGVQVINSEEELQSLKEGTVVIRSHGVPKRIYDRIEENGLSCVDATCPFVKRIHKIVQKESEEGRQIVIIGNAGHPEVEGIMGWAKGPAFVVESAEEIEKIPLKQDSTLCIVSQTTFNYKKFKELVEIIAKALVDNPDEVVVTETEKDKAIIVDLKVAASDMGKVIGKSGRIAKSIRSVVSAAASKTNKNVIVEINN